jgi:hypothetical protein
VENKYRREGALPAVLGVETKALDEVWRTGDGGDARTRSSLSSGGVAGQEFVYAGNDVGDPCGTVEDGGGGWKRNV